MKLWSRAQGAWAKEQVETAKAVRPLGVHQVSSFGPAAACRRLRLKIRLRAQAYRRRQKIESAMVTAASEDPEAAEQPKAELKQ